MYKNRKENTLVDWRSQKFWLGVGKPK